MAILFLTHKFPPSIGGMQKQSYELINGVRKHTNVYVLAQNAFESKLWFFIRLRFRVLKMLALHKDITTIHCNDGVMSSFVSVFVKFKGYKYCCTYHGLDLIFPNIFYQRILIPRIRKFDLFFCVSEYTAKECLSRGFDPERVHTVYNGVDYKSREKMDRKEFVDLFSRKYNIDFSSTKIILGIGRAVRRKGFSWFIKNVLPALPENARFVMVGPIEKATSLSVRLLNALPKSVATRIELFTGFASDSREIIHLLKHNDRAIHLGSLPYDELAQLLMHSDLFVMPNISVRGDMEGFGLVALEANLAGCPVLVSQIEGITSAVKDGLNGIYAQSEDQLDWIQRVRYLLGHPEYSKRLSKGAKDFVLENFSWDNMASKYYKIIEAYHEKEQLRMVLEDVFASKQIIKQ